MYYTERGRLMSSRSTLARCFPLTIEPTASTSRWGAVHMVVPSEALHLYKSLRCHSHTFTRSLHVSCVKLKPVKR
jgi:hypothetical protein